MKKTLRVKGVAAELSSLGLLSEHEPLIKVETIELWYPLVRRGCGGISGQMVSMINGLTGKTPSPFSTGTPWPYPPVNIIDFNIRLPVTMFGIRAGYAT